MAKLELQAPVLLKNETSGPLVFQDGTEGDSVVWQGAGNAMGEDIQPVPLKFLENNNFLRILNKGVLSLYEADDEIAAQLANIIKSPALQHQAEVWNRQRTTAAETATQGIDRKANRDFVTNGCIGPDARGTGQCGAEVSVREAQLGEKPPLCPAHSSLSTQFVQTEVQDETGTGKTIWTRPTLDAPRGI
jgi:hypothetical protein